MNVNIRTLSDPDGDFLAIATAEGHKYLGEGGTERSAVQDAINAMFTAQENALAAKSVSVIPPAPVAAPGTNSILKRRVAVTRSHIRTLLIEAASGKLLVDAWYQKPDELYATERRLRPTVVSEDHVRAHDQRSGEYRTYRLDRFERVELVG